MYDKELSVVPEVLQVLYKFTWLYVVVSNGLSARRISYVCLTTLVMLFCDSISSISNEVLFPVDFVYLKMLMGFLWFNVTTRTCTSI